MEPINEGGGSGSGAGLERQAVPPAPLSTAAAPEADADAEPASDAYDDEMLDGLADVSFPLGRFDDAEDDDPESGEEGAGAVTGAEMQPPPTPRRCRGAGTMGPSHRASK